MQKVSSCLSAVIDGVNKNTQKVEDAKWKIQIIQFYLTLALPLLIIHTQRKSHAAHAHRLRTSGCASVMLLTAIM